VYFAYKNILKYRKVVKKNKGVKKQRGQVYTLDNRGKIWKKALGSDFNIDFF